MQGGSEDVAMELAKTKEGSELRSSSLIDDSMVDLHWEISIEHWVRDDRSLLHRLRWLVWDVVGLGDPPSKAERATAEEVTTVRADSVTALPDQPNRRLVKSVPHRRHGMVSLEASANSW
jgi:hypothetical protein